METVSLKFSTKEQLLSFYSRLENIHCTIDLKDLVLSSAFSQADVLVAIKNYGVRILTEESIY
jgi:hypothetical protein